MKTTDTETIELDENEQIAQRRQKLAKLREQGNAFPNKFRRANLAIDIQKDHNGKDNDVLESEQNTVMIAGRIMMRRLMGKASFLQIQDMSGRMQLYVRKDNIADGVYDEFKSWDIGDIVGAEGVLFKTKTGELSVKVTAIQLLTKSLRPLPDKWHGLHDQETRYRQRYLDLIVNEQSKEVFKTRIKIIQTIREFLLAKEYLEVETPMMQVIPGGAVARPFVTHHNALDMDLYLRIAPELYLKRLVVGGFEKVFEINRNFRNEGLSTRHNPEFTMIEFYQAYADYNDLMDLTEQLMKQLAKVVADSYIIEYQDSQLDFSKTFTRLTVKEAILQYNSSLTVDDLESLDKLRTIVKKHDIKPAESWGLGKLQMELFEATVEDKLIQPTFITAYPTEVSPLARCNDDDPTVTDRFEFFIGGRELANGFSELNDPEEQAIRFKKQVADKDAGDLEAMHYDADYVNALEYGLPPTAGEGIGIDRLAMVFTNSPSIRDVLLFPHMRPQ